MGHFSVASCSPWRLAIRAWSSNCCVSLFASALETVGMVAALSLSQPVISHSHAHAHAHSLCDRPTANGQRHGRGALLFTCSRLSTVRDAGQSTNGKWAMVHGWFQLAWTNSLATDCWIQTKERRQEGRRRRARMADNVHTVRSTGGGRQFNQKERERKKKGWDQFDCGSRRRRRRQSRQVRAKQGRPQSTQVI